MAQPEDDVNAGLVDNPGVHVVPGVTEVVQQVLAGPALWPVLAADVGAKEAEGGDLVTPGEGRQFAPQNVS